MTRAENKDSNNHPEFGVDSRYTSKKESQSEATALMEARLARMKNVSKDDIIRAKLMQLKLNMEAFIKQPIHEPHNYFSEFLQSYIDAIYSKRSIFAMDLDITPSKLSQVINNHREPQDEFLLKLMIHSEKIYANVCPFQKEIWYQVYFHEKLCKMMSTQKEWTSKFENVVSVSEPITKYEK
ncbi:hypothetical protein H2O64_15720 [Kordia sp. YSTF-M3]|uniref:Uncharacterized protein n=1 Tax=Kordia aestuariivivens TaxID=2759037 RepID=A0ABR7QCQ2_9FLAO|nr:hypothetical protein [Kordia aestuariivivens]MBC8756124.1 hypothetical protein [Kordia aestuariivivens]